jgi:hypothetical protein
MERKGSCRIYKSPSLGPNPSKMNLISLYMERKGSCRIYKSPSLGPVPSKIYLIRSIIPYIRSTLILLLYLHLVLPICLFS